MVHFFQTCPFRFVAIWQHCLVYSSRRIDDERTGQAGSRGTFCWQVWWLVCRVCVTVTDCFTRRGESLDSWTTILPVLTQIIKDTPRHVNKIKSLVLTVRSEHLGCLADRWLYQWVRVNNLRFDLWLSRSTLDRRGSGNGGCGGSIPPPALPLPVDLKLRSWLVEWLDLTYDALVGLAIIAHVFRHCHCAAGRHRLLIGHRRRWGRMGKGGSAKNAPQALR